VVIPIVGGTFIPWCVWGNCASFGYKKALDGKLSSLSGIAVTGFTEGVNSYMQFNMGNPRSDIKYINIVGPLNQTFAPMPSNLTVFLSSSSSNFLSGVVCETSISFIEPADTATVMCPAGATGQYITVYSNVASQRLALMEVTPLYDGERAHAAAECVLSVSASGMPCWAWRWRGRARARRC
jgi:hypothetical protein